MLLFLRISCMIMVFAIFPPHLLFPTPPPPISFSISFCKCLICGMKQTKTLVRSHNMRIVRWAVVSTFIKSLPRKTASLLIIIDEKLIKQKLVIEHGKLRTMLVADMRAKVLRKLIQGERSHQMTQWSLRRTKLSFWSCKEAAPEDISRICGQVETDKSLKISSYKQLR